MLRKRKMQLGYAKNAFTLAEVLITLVIIGVVAAITIPAMIQQTQKQEYVAGLKKASSTLRNALYKMNNANGYPIGDYTYLENENFIDEFEKVANVTKRCNDTMGECFGANGTSNSINSRYKRLNGEAAEFTSSTHRGSFITNDGLIYSYGIVSKTHGISNEDKSNLLGRIVVDVNGRKGPNKFGYDFFMFYIVNGKGIIPAGNYSASDCVKTGNGYTCAAKVLRENKIDY